MLAFVGYLGSHLTNVVSKRPTTTRSPENMRPRGPPAFCRTHPFPLSVLLFAIALKPTAHGFFVSQAFRAILYCGRDGLPMSSFQMVPAANRRRIAASRVLLLSPAHLASSSPVLNLIGDVYSVHAVVLTSFPHTAQPGRARRANNSIFGSS